MRLEKKSKELLNWAFEIIDLAKNYDDVFTEINIFLTEDFFGANDFFTIKFKPLDKLTKTIYIKKSSSIKTIKSERQNKAIDAMSDIANAKRFNKRWFTKEIVEVHFEWLITVIKSLIEAHQLKLKLYQTEQL